MLTMRCYLGPSRIEGLGVFCTQDIRKDDIVWQFDPLLDICVPIAHMNAAPEHIREFLDRYTYDHPTDPTLVILDGDEGRFMNHAEDPNLDFSGRDFGRALCDIPQGVELTCNYADFTHGEWEMQPPRHRVSAIGGDALPA